MTHARDRQVFGAVSVGEGWGMMTVRAMFHICMELWGIVICLIFAGGIFIATPQKPDELASKYSCRSPACFFLDPTRSAGIFTQMQTKPHTIWFA